VTTEVQIKNPGDSADVPILWSNLGNTTLSSVSHAVPADLGVAKVGESTDIPNSTSYVQLSGGTHGQIIVITATATLANGRTLVRTVTVRIFVQ
jgi:hypothetical protein